MTTAAEYADAWAARVQRYQGGDKAAMPAQVVGLGQWKVLGASGDDVVGYPLVLDPDDVDDIDSDAYPDVRWAVECALKLALHKTGHDKLRILGNPEKERPELVDNDQLKRIFTYPVVATLTRTSGG